jgi:predicted TPR repeat methyltransferase
MGEAEHVLDLGSGAGDGTRRLANHFPRVTGLDSSSEALAFAREWAPLATFIQADVMKSLPCEPAGLCVVSDVLGHLTQPERALLALRSASTTGAMVLVAEPLAFALQRLQAPQRRASSPRSLEGLLTRAGFAVSEWICTRGTFVACIARPVRARDAEALIAACAACEGEDWQSAREAVAEAKASPSMPIAREAHLLEAKVSVMSGDGDGAARALFRAAEIDPHEARALAGLGELALASGDATTALRLALRAAALDGAEPAAARVAARAANELGHPDELNAWRVAHSLCPDDGDLASGLARAAAMRGDHALAIAALERARSYGGPMGSGFHVELAELLLAEGRTADAEIELELAHASCPDDAAARRLWARVRESSLDARR